MKRYLLAVCMALSLGCLAGNPVDSLLRIIRNKPADTNLVKEYTQLAWQYFYAGDSANAAGYLARSGALSQSLHFNKGLLESYSNLAMLYTAYGKPDSSLRYLSLCLQKAQALHQPSVASKCCLNLASAYLNRADYAQSIRYYIQALRYFDQLNDEPKIAMTDHCIGIAYYLMRNYPLSLSYYRQSIAMAQKLGKPEGAAYSYNGIGVIYKELHQYDTALYYLNQSYALAVKTSDKTLLSHNLSNLGEVYSLQHHDEQALTYLNKAHALQLELSDQRGMAETDVLTGELYLRQKNFGTARSAFGAARLIATRAELRDILKNAFKGLSAAYQGLHEDGKALEAYQAYAALKDSLYTSESTRQIADMQTKYDTEKKEHENALLLQENEIKNLQISKEKSQKYILISSFIFLALLGLVYYNRHRLQQKNKLLRERELRTQAVFQAQEQEKARLSKDLHDGVGALLSLIKLNISGIEPGGPHDALLVQTKDLASRAMKEVREVSHSLMPGLLARAGLRAALGELVGQVNASGAVNMVLNDGMDVKLKPEAELAIFRMIQEAVNNLLKYADATQASISLLQKPGALLITIADNGRGFDQSELAEGSGNGLDNLASRAGMFNGSAHVTSDPGQGATVTIQLPLTSLIYG